MDQWNPRRPGELTSEYLGRVLEDYLHLNAMAQRARLKHYDDFFCPKEIADGMEILRLVNELHEVAKRLTRHSPQWKRVMYVIDQVKEGEFDGTREESSRWAASEDGQEAMAEFPEDIRNKLFGV
jgi:hypothetical protein